MFTFFFFLFSFTDYIFSFLSCLVVFTPFCIWLRHIIYIRSQLLCTQCMCVQEIFNSIIMFSASAFVDYKLNQFIMFLLFGIHFSCIFSHNNLLFPFERFSSFDVITGLQLMHCPRGMQMVHYHWKASTQSLKIRVDRKCNWDLRMINGTVWKPRIFTICFILYVRFY